MGMMIIRHKVRDYGQWRPMFDAHEIMGIGSADSGREFPKPPDED